MHRLLAMMVLLPVCTSIGCSGSNGGSDGNGNENENGTTGQTPSTRTPDGFPTAAKVSFDDVNFLSIEGTIGSGDDIEAGGVVYSDQGVATDIGSPNGIAGEQSYKTDDGQGDQRPEMETA